MTSQHCVNFSEKNGRHPAAAANPKHYGSLMMPRKWKKAPGGGFQARHCAALSLPVLMISATLAFGAYAVFFPGPAGGAAASGGLCQWWSCQCSAGSSMSGVLRTAGDGAPTSLSHIVFGIGGTARTWSHRRGYVELWWRPGVTRGHVWLDEEPRGPWPAATNPPYRVSADASRFGRRASASRMARIVADSFALAAAANGTGEDGGGEVRWFVMGDDDTVFFPDNLVAVLRKYDHEQAYYVGAPSESVAQDMLHSYGMAFGGGGFAVSYPAAAELAGAIDGCLERYRNLFGSDERVHACLSELGIPLTREPGFHQMDLHGDAYGLLAAHPVAPLVSLHHLDLIQPISPHGRTPLDAVRSLVDAAQLDPARSLQQAFCYHHHHGGGGSYTWSVSVAWGYAAQLYPWAVPAHQLEVPLQTFKAFRGRPDGPFLFNTRPWRPDDACARPVSFFLSHARNETAAAAATVTEYSRHAGGKSTEKECDKPSFRSAAAVQTVSVLAPKVSPADWERAPRRHCCETAWTTPGSVLEVRIRRCRGGELTASTP